MLIMVKAIIRPDKANNVMAKLMADGFPAVTKLSVAGRGKQRGIKIGEVTYDEVPKTMLLFVIKDTDKDLIIRDIIATARTGEKGAFGDGKIFISPVEEMYTVSSGIKETGADASAGPAPETPAGSAS
jgi:nitrogen regulatory protein PII 1